MNIVEDSFVTVGREFASLLGYEEVIGAMGIIDDVMNALCSITVVHGDPSFIGKQLDIHKKDCVPVKDISHNYGVIINKADGHVYYSDNLELVEFTERCLYRVDKKSMRNIKDIEEVVTFCAENYETTRANKDFQWLFICLDNEADELAKPFRETYEAELEAKREEQEAFCRMTSKPEVSNLTKAFLKQMDTITADGSNGVISFNHKLSSDDKKSH